MLLDYISKEASVIRYMSEVEISQGYALRLLFL